MKALTDAALVGLRARVPARARGPQTPSISTDSVVRAIVLQHIYSVAQDQLFEELRYNLLFRWFVGVGEDVESWDRRQFEQVQRTVLADLEISTQVAAVLSQARYLLLGQAAPATGSRVDARVLAALAYIERHVADPRLSLSTVAAHVRLSTWHFDRLFTKTLGYGLRSAITSTRMTRARVLLSTTFLSIKEIGYQLGYKNLRQFHRQFAQCYGTSPVVARKTWRS